MSFKRFIAFIILTNAAFAMLPNDLIFTPYANFPKKNQTELGYQLSYYSISAKTNDKGIYFSHSFSQNIRYGMEFYESSQTNHLFHHFAYRLGQIFPNSNYHFMFAGGFNYLSNTPQVLKNKYLHEGSLTTTWMPVHSPINISLTLSKKRFKNEFIGMANIAYHQAWGTLALEWDDVYLNLSSQFDIKKRFKFRAGITKNLQSATEIVFKTGVGLVDFDHSFTSPTKNFESAPPPVSTVNASVGLIHLQEGMQFYYNGEFKQAKKSYELAVKFFPHSAIVRERLGSIYYKLNEFEKAQIEWTKANAISPSSRLERYILEAREKGEGLNQ